MTKKKIQDIPFAPIIEPNVTSIKFPSMLMTLALMTTLTPITGSYTFSFLLLLWLTFGLRSYSATVPPDKKNLTKLEKVNLATELTFRQHLKSFNTGIVIFAAFQVISALGAYLTSDFAPTAKEIFSTTSHLLGKWLALWIVISQSFAILLRHGWNPLVLRAPFLAWIILYTLYCFAQRTWGLDWVRGFNTSLGANRLAYGVYRISGMMSHPLTLTYNLMVIFFLSLSLSFSEKRPVNFLLKKFISWKTIAFISALILVASGSRFVLLVIPPAIICAYFKPLNQLLIKIIKKKDVGLTKIIIPYSVIIIFILIFIGHSSLSRFEELFDWTIPWQTRWPRLVYWDIHWDIFLSHPYFGVSVAKVSTAAQALAQERNLSLEMMNAHNLFLQFLADSGITGFMGLCLLIFFMIKGSQDPKVIAPFQWGMKSLLFGLIGASLSQNVLRDSEFVFALWIALILLMATSAYSQSHTNNGE